MSLHMDKMHANPDAGRMPEAYADRLWESVETHQLSDDALTVLTDMVVDCSSDGQVLRANQAFCDFEDLKLSEIPQKMCEDFVFLQNREAARCTLELTSADGTQIWIDRIQLSMRDAKTGKPFIRIVGRDVSEHKRSELALIEARKRAEDADAAKSRFLAMVSHEIRTPLNGIIGMGKLLSDTSLSPEQHNYVDAISTSGEALLVLVNDLLQFGRQELTEDDIKSEPTEIAPLIAGVMELLAEKAYGKNLDLGYHISEDVPPKISVDAGRLRQILFNLVGNAVKFTKVGGVRVDIDFQMPETLLIHVRDSGPGISAEHQEVIFKPFEQVENTFTRTHDGAGLGLAIAKRMAMAMGGDIGIESDTGIGSTFSVSIRAQGIGVPDSPQKLMVGETVLLCAKPGIEEEVLKETIRLAGGSVHFTSTISNAAAIAADNHNIKRVILDQRLDDDIQTETENRFPAHCHLTALIEPESRGTTGAHFKASGHSFLTRPVRPSTALRVLTSNPDAVERICKAEENQRSYQSLNVLLAEDNPINALLAQKQLERAGYTIKLVENGRDAVDAVCSDHNFDLILMDLHMPVMDGLAAIKAIRQNEEDRGAKSVTIIAVTADNHTETLEQILAAGATSMLDKPLNFDALQAVVGAQSASAA